MSLVLIWAILLSAIILIYTILDGFDLGIGIIFPWVKDKHCRDIMVSTIAPVWDGNETWLVFGAAALYAAFPLAYGILLPALYMPIMIMVSALIFRGVAFEFRFKSEHHQKAWDHAFSIGSTVASLMQGMILGRFVQGYGSEMQGPSYSYHWITPFSILTGITVVIGYALLGTTWLIMRTEGNLQTKLFKVAKPLLFATGISLGAVCISTLLIDSRIIERWLAYAYILWMVPVVAVGLIGYAFYSLQKKHDTSPFFLSVGIFICSYIGFAASVFPYVIPHALTIWEAAAPASSLKFSLIGTAVILPLLLVYTSYTYYVFRGKVTETLHY